MTVLFAIGCVARAQLSTLQLQVADIPITVEVADEPEERHTGLMYRKSMGPDEGMLFVYPKAQPLSFWMKNTNLPLSIAYLDETGRILNIEDMTPHDETGVKSAAPALYALEMNKGWYAEHDVERGAVVTGLPPASAL